MILVLTYHQVAAGGAAAGAADFYTVTRDDFARQLDVLIEVGLKPQDPADLQTQAGERLRCFLSFDDGTVDHFELVHPLLEQLGLKAVYFVPTSKLGRPGHMQVTHLRELVAAGHLIGLHSHEHTRMDRLDDAAMRGQFMQSRRVLQEQLGVRPWLFAPPGGFMNEHLREVALGFGARAIRTMRWGYNENPDFSALETIPLNRHITLPKFRQIIRGRRTRLLYFVKQAAKAIVSPRDYERLRRAAFRLFRSR